MHTLARITSKGQTTIPLAVRTALKLAPGDSILWVVGDDGVAHVRRAGPLDLDHLRALEGTLEEWAGDADEAAYREL